MLFCLAHFGVCSQYIITLIRKMRFEMAKIDSMSSSNRTRVSSVAIAGDVLAVYTGNRVSSSSGGGSVRP